MGGESRSEDNQAEALCFEDAAERELWLSFFRDDLQTEPLPKYAALAADERLAEVRKRSGPSKAERIVEMLRARWKEAEARAERVAEKADADPEKWGEESAFAGAFSLAALMAHDAARGLAE